MQIVMNRSVGFLSRVEVDGMPRFGVGITYGLGGVDGGISDTTPFSSGFPDLTWRGFYEVALPKVRRFGVSLDRDGFAYADKLLYNTEGFKAHVVVDGAIYTVTEFLSVEEVDDQFVLSFEGSHSIHVARVLWDLVKRHGLVSLVFWL